MKVLLFLFVTKTPLESQISLFRTKAQRVKSYCTEMEDYIELLEALQVDRSNGEDRQVRAALRKATRLCNDLTVSTQDVVKELEAILKEQEKEEEV